MVTGPSLDTSRSSFGDWLRRQRRSLDLTQAELADRVGCSRSALRKLEAEELRPSKQLAELLAEALGIPATAREAFVRAARSSQTTGEWNPSAPSAPVAPLKHNLPLQLTSFVGRADEMEEVKRLLAGGRLLTLTGPGGIGKTRLALRVADELVDQYKDGVWLVELAPISDPALVPQTIATTFGLDDKQTGPFLATLSDYLRTRNLLLILDNCEHLLEAAASLAGELLRRCAGLHILATSREALGIAGENAYPVPSLSLPHAADLTLNALAGVEAMHLFVDRARAVQPSFSLTHQNASAVADVCKQLDGIPLAIELAAARVKGMSVEQIAGRLDDRFRLLMGGSRTALPRHRTLHAAIDWSHDLLPEPEKALFRRLSVFTAGWTLEAAEAVCAGNDFGRGQVLDLISRLVDRSLLIFEEQDGAGRYRMLETLRQYASEKLRDSGEFDAINDRHLEFFVLLCENAESRLYGAEQVLWLNRLDLEMGNWRAALEWSMGDRHGEGQLDRTKSAQAGLRLAGALLWYFMARSPREASELLKEMLAGEGAQPRMVARAKALNAAGYLQWALGNYDTARRLLEEAFTIAEELGDPLNAAWASVYLGAIADSQGDDAAAQSYLEKGVEFARALGDVGRFVRGAALAFWGDVPLHGGDDQRAQEMFEESIALLRGIGDKNFLAYPLRRLGYMALRQGDCARAAHLFKESLVLNHEVGHPTGELACLVALAATCATCEGPTAAVTLDASVAGLAKALRITLFTADQTEHDRYFSAVRAQVDRATFDAAWAEGSAMSLEQAVTYALASV